MAATGLPTTRPNAEGTETERFSGHSARVSGAQWPSRLGMGSRQIQLLSRRSSAAVERYLQPLLRVEDAASSLLHPESGPRSHVRQQDLDVESPPGNRAPDEPCRDEGKAGELGAVATSWQHCKINCRR